MASNIARDMVCRFGMSPAFGFQSFYEASPFVAEEQPPRLSQKTAEAIDAEVARLISQAYERAKKLIDDNRGKLELLATTLLEKETMDGRDVERLLGLEKPSEDDASATIDPEPETINPEPETRNQKPETKDAPDLPQSNA